MENKLKYSMSVGLLILFVVGLIGITAYVSKTIFLSLNEDENNTYVLRDLVSTYIPVNTEINDVLKYPYNDTNVKVHINYYNINDEPTEQERSLILYENTYMPNTGILYGSSNKFDILAVADGKVSNIEDDEIFGHIITITHNNNLISKYASIDDIKVNINDDIKSGEIIATSSNNKIVSETQNMLLFELIYNGEYVNPNKYYNTYINEMS